MHEEQSASRLARENRFLRELQKISAAEALDPIENLRAVQRVTCAELGLECSMIRVRRSRDETATTPISTFCAAEVASPSDEDWDFLLECREPAARGGEGLSELPASSPDGVSPLIGMSLAFRGRSRGAVAFWGSQSLRRPLHMGDAEIVRLAVSHISTLVHIQSELNRAVSAFHRMAPLEASALFAQATQEASSLVRAPTAFIAEHDVDDPSRLNVHSLWSKGQHLESFSYDVSGSPCEAALRGSTVHIPVGVRDRHPEWMVGARVGAEGYIGVPIMNWSGQVLGVLGVVDAEPIPRAAFQDRLLRDLASRVCAGIERARMDASLRASQRRLEVALRAGKVAIWEVDLASQSIRPNAIAAEMIGLTPETVPTDFRAWMKRIHPGDIERERARYERLPESERHTYSADLRVRHENGTWRDILASGSVFQSENGATKSLVSAGIDVTEKRRFEERLRQAQKMENLATLAGGIAHDFNNLLMSIGGNAAFALRKQPNPQVEERLGQISLATERAADLTHQLLVYAGRGATEPQLFGLGALVIEISGLLDTVISKKAQLDLDCSDSPPLEADPGQIRQVVMNLLTNASEALQGEKGYIAVKTGRQKLTRADLAECWGTTNNQPGTYAFVRVSDTGVGIPFSVRPQIFDPFFTTKPSGRGLGMAVVIGVVSGHRGAIRLRSEAGRGTEITVYLPLSDKTLPEALATSETAEPTSPGAGRILVVEDETMIRELAANVLEDAGYDVVTAAGGQEGLARFADHRGQLTAVLLDVTMPDMSGVEVLARIRETDSTTPVVLMSGYTAAQSDPDNAAASAYLKKPFALNDLVSTLQSVTRR